MLKRLKRLWTWLGRDANHNAAMVIITAVAVVFAFPYFSRQISNVQVSIDSIAASVQELFSQQVTEYFHYNQVKDFKKVQSDSGADFLQIPLQEEPVKNSVMLWFGGVLQTPDWYKTDGRLLLLKLNSSLETSYWEVFQETYPSTSLIVVTYTRF